MTLICVIIPFCLCACLLYPCPCFFYKFAPFKFAVFSPPLPLAQPSHPYFLHSADPSLCPDFCNSLADPRPHNPVGRKSPEKLSFRQWADSTSPACIHRHESSSDTTNESMEDFGMDSICDYRDYEQEQNTQLAHKQIEDSKSSDTASNSMCNFDSLYCSDSLRQSKSDAPACPTPYKNIDVIMTYSNKVSAVDSLCYSVTEKPSHTHTSYTDRVSKELPPLPTFYMYHPKNCPLHRGAPPRLSPIGALSPPQRSGAPPRSGLSSPLFPRSHTLPALAAPLYYPNLYPPILPKAPPLPPKLYQAPPQSHVASKTSLSLFSSPRS